MISFMAMKHLENNGDMDSVVRRLSWYFKLKVISCVIGFTLHNLNEMQIMFYDTSHFTLHIPTFKYY